MSEDFQADDAGGGTGKAVGHGVICSLLTGVLLVCVRSSDGSFGLYERTGASAALWETDSGMVQQDDKKAQKGIEKVYHSFDNIDFTDRNNKTILKIVLINALILTVITVLWFYGIVAVVIYSIILFFILL